jgi:hypothetical protein
MRVVPPECEVLRPDCFEPVAASVVGREDDGTTSLIDEQHASQPLIGFVKRSTIETGRARRFRKAAPAASEFSSRRQNVDAAPHGDPRPSVDPEGRLVGLQLA